MAKPLVLLLSSSQVHGHQPFEYAMKEINDFLRQKNVKTILFVPYAAIDYDAYYNKVANVFGKFGFQMESVHTGNPTAAVNKAEAIFIGGGNTFLLLKTLYDNDLVKLISSRVFEDGIPYIGSSAGSNVAAPTIHNTNDMPIVYPPSFEGLNLIPFNINPHYIDPDPDSKHKGETREERILQYHSLPNNYPIYHVLGMREGCMLLVEGQRAVLKGISNGRLFIKGKPASEITRDADISFLMKACKTNPVIL